MEKISTQAPPPALEMSDRNKRRILEYCKIHIERGMTLGKERKKIKFYCDVFNMIGIA